MPMLSWSVASSFHRPMIWDGAVPFAESGYFRQGNKRQRDESATTQPELPTNPLSL